MDKPLKFFIGLSVGFFAFILFIISLEVNRSNVGSDDSLNGALLEKAESRAKETIDTLFRLYPLFPSNSFVKFTLKNNKGISEVVWGTVTELEQDHVTASVLRKFDPENSHPRSVDLPIGHIQDWLVEVETGKIRGGYSTQALLIKEKGDVHDTKVDSQLNLFLDRIDL